MECHLEPFFSISLNPSAPLFLLFLPTASSIVITGTPIISRNTKYKRTKKPPPFSPTRYGNFQTFPIPMAQPALTRIKPSLELKLSLSFTFPYLPFYPMLHQNRSCSRNINRAFCSILPDRDSSQRPISPRQGLWRDATLFAS